MGRLQASFGRALTSISIASAALRNKQEVAKKSVKDTRTAKLEQKKEVERAKADIAKSKATKAKSKADIAKANASIAKSKFDESVYKERLKSLKGGNT